MLRTSFESLTPQLFSYVKYTFDGTTIPRDMTSQISPIFHAPVYRIESWRKTDSIEMWVKLIYLLDRVFKQQAAYMALISFLTAHFLEHAAS